MAETETNNENPQDTARAQDFQAPAQAADKPAEGARPKVDQQLLEDVIDAIRPSFQADGGDLELFGVDENGVVSIELQGACSGCSLSDMTVSQGIERVLIENVPGVTRVQAVV